MATTVGGTVSSTEMVVAQFDDVAEGTTVESLKIEFDQAKFEEYLSSSSSGGKASRRRRRVVRVACSQATKTAMPECSTRATAGSSTSFKPTKAEPMAEVRSHAAVKQPMQPRREGFKIHLGADHAITVDAESKRARQRRRQALARQRAAAPTRNGSLDYYSSPRRAHYSGEPTFTGGPRISGKSPKTGELGIPGEPHLGELSKSGEVHSSKCLAGNCSSGGTHEARPNKQTAGAGQWTEARLKRPRRSRQARLTSGLGSSAHSCKDPLAPSISQCSTNLSENGGCHLQPTGDLRDHLTRKRAVREANPQCHCEKLIQAVLADCSCAPKSSVFERLSQPCQKARPPRRRQNRRNRRTAEDSEPTVASVNMTGKSKVTYSDSSDPEFALGPRYIPVDSKGVFQRTRLRTGAAIPFDYAQLNSIPDSGEEAYSAEATSQTSSSAYGRHARVHMVDGSEDWAKKFEEQQTAIESMREMMSQLLQKKKRASRNRPRGRRNHERGPTPRVTDEEDNHGPPSDYSSRSSEKASQAGSTPRDKRLDEFQDQLDALKLQKSMNELGVVRPYPIEWDTVPYPAKFKPVGLTQFDGKGSPSQHVYYFLSQTGFLTKNDPILTRLFIGTLKGVAFEWFRKLAPGSINSWADLEKQFLARFFDDDTEVSMATLLAEKQKKTESVSEFVKRFRNRSLHCRDQVSDATLIEMCRNNLSIGILSKIGAVETRTWKELVRQGEQVENMIKRLEAEEPQPKKGPTEAAFPKNSSRSKGKETMAVDSSPTPKAQYQKPKTFEQRPQKHYDFKEDWVAPTFETLLQSKKIKLPEAARPAEVGKTDDPNYCAYHRFIGHPTAKCFILKDKLQALFEAGVLTKEKVQKKVTTNMVTLKFGTNLPEVHTPAGVVPIPKAELKIINTDPHNQREKGLVSQTLPSGQVMWVHPDLIKDEQWTSKPRPSRKRGSKPCNAVSVIPDKDEPGVATPTDSEEETAVLVTRAGKEFAKNYPSTTENPTRPALGSQPAPQGEVVGTSSSNPPFRFDVLAQLANIPARITLYELLRLSKPSREALREALADSEVFSTHFPPAPEEEAGCPQCCQVTRRQIPCITFTPEDMLTRTTSHDRPLYFTGYVGSSRVDRIQVDPGSALSIVPLTLIRTLGIPQKRLSTTTTTIFGFNATGTRPLGKIRLKCRIGDMKTEVTCYVIDAEPSYNMLLGRPWIHSNCIVPSTLHQCLKYVDESGQVRTVVADQQPFKGVENYFTDALLYLDDEPSHEVPVEDPGSGNEADGEFESNEGLVLNNVEPIVIGYEDPTSEAEELTLNEDLEFAYPRSSPKPDLDSLVPGLSDNLTLHLPIWSSLVTDEQMIDSSRAIFIIPAQDDCQQEIIFGRIDLPTPMAKDDSEDDEPAPQFACYDQVAKSMMEGMGYDFTRHEGLNYGKGRKTPVKSAYVPKGKPDNYYSKTRRGLGYTSSSSELQCHFDEGSSDAHSDERSSPSSVWNSDVSIGDWFANLSVNMISSNVIEIREDEQVPLYDGIQVRYADNDHPEGQAPSPSSPDPRDWFASLTVNMTSSNTVEVREDEPISPHDEAWDRHVSAQWSGRFEQREPPTKDEVLRVNMGDEANPKPIFINAGLSSQEREELIALVREYIDVFAWNYEDMPGLDPRVAMHRLDIKLDAKPVKQQQRRFRPQIMEAIVAEIKKLIEAGFIREEQHPDWVANIVPVLKKNGTIRICVDYRDLNAACPKDEFPLPITDVIIDNTCGFERMSFMDGFSGYNQIKMHPEDEKHTAFRTPVGIYCYTVMPFGLKNAGATYQRAMSTIFQDHLRKTVECYVDDLVVKSRRKDDHLQDLRTVFEIMRKHQLKMNPTKSFLGMSSGKFLGFVVTTKGVYVDPDKVRAIRELQPPRNLKELRGLQGRLAYIRRFIANLSGKCQPFSKLMKKGASFVWDESCQQAFEEIKNYLLNPPVLAAPVSGKPFLVYIRATEHSLAALLAQNDDAGHEQGIYYLSRTLQGAEQRYPMVEKECLALVFAIQKMRHYLVGQTIHVVSRTNPIRVFMTQPGTLSWRLARWALLLSQYDIYFTPRKSVKGQAICDLMASHPLGSSPELFEDIPDETHEANMTSQKEVWRLYFDGASRVGTSGFIVAGVGVVLISPQNHVLPQAFSLTEPCSNNVAEYNALLIGLNLAREMEVKHLEAYGDSQLIVRQMTGEYEVRNDDLIPCHRAAVELTKSFDSFRIEHVLRSKNTHADALASLAANLAQPLGTSQCVTVASRRLFQPEYTPEVCTTHQVTTQLEPRDWRFPIIDFVLYGILPEDRSERDSVRRRAPRFYYNSVTKTLYRRSYDGLLLRCLSTREAREALREAHDGTCGAHQPGPKLWDRLRRMGYYWPRMISDAVAYSRRCRACQIHANYIRQPHEDLHPTATSWPFEAWGMDVVGPISPPSAKGHRFILAITDYFSKWAEAIPLREVKTGSVINFIKHHVIFRYGVPRRIIHDNGPQFVSLAFVRFCDKFRMQNLSTTAYNPSANGLAEAFNKTIIKILAKLTSHSKRDWDEKLGESLWAYRTTVRTPTGATPYSLVYGCEAVLPLEIQIPSLRVALATGMTKEEKHRQRLAELEALDEKRLEAQQHIELYQARVSRAFDKKVKRRSFKKEDLVLAVRRPMILNSKKKGKFQPKWEGPFIIETVYSNGAYRLAKPNGDKILMPINGKFLKKYYP